MATIGSENGGYFVAASNMGARPEYIHNSIVDGDTKYGRSYGTFLRRSRVGSEYTANTTCGSRGVIAYNNTAYIASGHS